MTCNAVTASKIHTAGRRNHSHRAPRLAPVRVQCLHTFESTRVAAMALNIRNGRAEKLVNEVARRTGETKTQAVITALQERLAHLSRPRGERKSLAEELTFIARECATLPVQDARSADVILGYGEDGLSH